MNRLVLTVCLTVFVLMSLPGQESPEQEKRKVSFLPALGINLFSNTVLYLINRYIAQEHWAQISFDSIKTNFTNPWVWDGDEYFTNQFGHPYQGSIYHAAARSSGFTFYESLLFDAFGSATWELIFETNAPAMNDLISTTIGGASLGEMFHRLYLAIPSPFAALISPADALTDILLKRRNIRKTTNLYCLKLAFGAGYSYSRQAAGKIRKDTLIPLRESHSISAGISCDIIYGDPFVQQSWTPYTHFELSVSADGAYPFWYNFNIQSNGYLFSFNVMDTEKTQASTGLTLHYDLFTDRHINFFAESLDWTFKYMHLFTNSWNLVFKGHLGGLIFNADNSYFFNGYSNLRQTENNYGTGINLKFSVSTGHPKWGNITFHSSVYEVFSVFRNKNADSRDILFLYFDLSYSYPLGEHWNIGLSASAFWNTVIVSIFKNTEKGTYTAELFIGRTW